jgi:O-antigen/teichoic acid export membrane protein
MISAGLKSYLNIKERYYDYGIVDLARQFSIFLTSVIYFYTLNSNNYIELLEFNYLFSSMIMIFLAFVFIKKNEVELSLSINKLKNLVFKSKFLIFYTSLIPVLIFIDSYFVDSYLTEEDLGIYSFSIKIYNISLMLVVPIFTVLNIRQIEIAKEDNYLSFTKENLNKIILFSVVILFLSIFLNWVLVNYLFIDYRESFWITNLLILASFITYITLPFSFLIAYRKYKHLFFLGVIGVSVNIGLNFLLIQKYGMIIAALSTFVSQLIINLGAAIFSYFLLKNKKHED